MKTDLQILIEHLQSEYDYLKSSMDECVAEWDFDGAKAFREPVFFTKRKLDILKCLENPNFNKINRLAGNILRIEKSLTERKFDSGYLESIQKKINESKKELEKLRSIDTKQRIDDDKILALLESLERNHLSEVEFEIKKEKIFLLLSVKNQQAELEFKTQEGVNIEDYLAENTKSIIRKLGFNTETYKKEIPNFNRLNKIKVLEELAIVYFEVFEIFGEERNIKFE